MTATFEKKKKKKMEGGGGSDECYCSKAEMDLFTAPPINADMERGVFVNHFPIATLAPGAPIEFSVPASPEDYLDLGRTTLQLTMAVRKADGTALRNDQLLVPVQLLLHSMFQQVDVKLNDRLVTPSLNTYPYKAYLETLLSHGADTKNSYLSNEGWFGGPGEGPDQSNPYDDDATAGVKARGRLILSGRDFQLEGRPHVDIFQQERYLLPGVNMHLKFQPTRPAFHLFYDHDARAGGAAQGHFTTVIRRATLRVRRVRCNPGLSLEHAKRLESGLNALYPLRRGVVTTFTVAQGGQSFVKENLIQGQLPRRAFVCMVSNAAFNGANNTNPYAFSHYDLNFLSASVGTETYPSQPFKPNFQTDQYAHVYTDLMRTIGSLNSNRGCGISYEDFKAGGHVIFGFDFTADMAEGPHRDRIKYGSLRLEGHFAAALANAVNVIVYAEYDNVLQIDRARNVVADFGST